MDKELENEPIGLDLYISLIRLIKKGIFPDNDDIDWDIHFTKFPSIQLFIMMNIDEHKYGPEELFEWLNMWKNLLFFRFKMDLEQKGESVDLYDQLVTYCQEVSHLNFPHKHYTRLAIWFERQRNCPEARPIFAEMMMNKIDLLWEGLSKEKIGEIRRERRKSHPDWIDLYDQLKKFHQQMGRLPQNPESKLYQWYREQKRLPRSNFRRVLVDHIEL